MHKSELFIIIVALVAAGPRERRSGRTGERGAYLSHFARVQQHL